MPDGGVFDPKVIDEIAREIKGLGDNWKGLSESMATDLAAVRRLAEDTKGSVGPEVKAQMDALTASVTGKHATLETKFSARLTTLETKANRHGRRIHRGAGQGCGGPQAVPHPDTCRARAIESRHPGQG
jgi:hypothetical protein